MSSTSSTIEFFTKNILLGSGLFKKQIHLRVGSLLQKQNKKFFFLAPTLSVCL